MSLQPTPIQPMASTSHKPVWRPWTLPLDPIATARKLCGLLNKLTRYNFDSVAERVAQVAVTIERDGNPAILDAFVQALFLRGVQDPERAELYVALCVRVVDELESERALWRRVDLYHVGNTLHSFETALRLAPLAEFRRYHAARDWRALFALLAFLGDLLVHGMLYATDLHDIMITLFDLARHGDPDATIALCRFTHRVAKAFNANQVLECLQIAPHIQDVLHQESLPSMVRYLFMGTLDTVIYPTPKDAFNSSRERIEVYGIGTPHSSVSDAASDSDVSMADDTVDMVRLEQSCAERSTLFFERRVHEFAERALRDLRPEHRHFYLRRLIADVLRASDTEDARLVGSLWLLESTRELVLADDAFLVALSAELAALPDTLLDVPHACRLVAIIVQETTLDDETVENVLWQSLPQHEGLRLQIMEELRSRAMLELEGVDYSSVDDESRKNRFERERYGYGSSLASSANPGPSGLQQTL